MNPKSKPLTPDQKSQRNARDRARRIRLAQLVVAAKTDPRKKLELAAYDVVMATAALKLALDEAMASGAAPRAD